MHTLIRLSCISGNVTSAESILSAPLQESHQELSFQPLFIDELKDPNNATLALCGDNVNCQFDYQITGKESIAMETKEFGDGFKEIKMTLTTGMDCSFKSDCCFEFCQSLSTIRIYMYLFF